MSAFFSAMFGVVGVVCVVALFVFWGFDIQSRREKARSLATREAAERELRKSLESASRWFGHDPAVVQLIHGLAEGRSPIELRNEWDRNKEALPESPD